MYTIPFKWQAVPSCFTFVSPWIVQVGPHSTPADLNVHLGWGMWLLKVFECVWLLLLFKPRLSFSFGFVFTFLYCLVWLCPFPYWLIVCCYVIGLSYPEPYSSSLNYFEVDPNHKYGEIDSTYEEICSSGLMDVGCSGQCVEIHTWRLCNYSCDCYGSAGNIFLEFKQICECRCGYVFHLFILELLQVYICTLSKGILIWILLISILMVIC